MSDLVSQSGDAGSSRTGKQTRMRPRTAALLAIAVVFGLLLWAKLLLVTGHPRTAIADPDEAGPAESPPAVVDGSAGGSR